MTGLTPVFREGGRKDQWSLVDHTTTGRRKEENIAVHLCSQSDPSQSIIAIAYRSN